MAESTIVLLSGPYVAFHGPEVRLSTVAILNLLLSSSTCQTLDSETRAHVLLHGLCSPFRAGGIQQQHQNLKRHARTQFPKFRTKHATVGRAQHRCVNVNLQPLNKLGRKEVLERVRVQFITLWFRSSIRV
jgi:hypothetical protein